jgi:hypothetical protein
MMVLFLLVSGFQPASETAVEADTTAADEAAIRELVGTFDSAVLAEDIDAMMSRYSENSMRIPRTHQPPSAWRPSVDCSPKLGRKTTST